MFVSPRSIVGVELKLGTTSSVEQIAKYIAILLWEMEVSGSRNQLGLLFIVPDRALANHWEATGLGASQIDSGFLDRLDFKKLPKRAQELLREKASTVRWATQRLRMQVLSWDQFRNSLIAFRAGLDEQRAGDQTLVRLLKGLEAQIEQHGNTGISTELASSDGTDQQFHT